MSDFIKFMSREHVNHANVALYQSDKSSRCKLQAEVVGSGKLIGYRWFENQEEAESFYESFPGSGLGLCMNVIDELKPRDDD